MLTEIITIGDEILIGQIVDTNSAWMGQQVVQAGGEVTRITTIQDSVDVICEALAIAEKRSELILLTGGLGPTKDDVTKDALCKYFDCELELREDVLAHLEDYYKTRNRELREANRTQAYLPSKSITLQNNFGTAPGMRFDRDGVTFVSMPGVPYEMKALMEEFVLPEFQKRSEQTLRHRTTVTANVPESVLAAQLSDFESELPSNIKLAYLPHMNFVRVRLTGRGNDEYKLESTLDELQIKLKTVLGDVVIAFDDVNIGIILGRLLKERKETMSIAESCTGGYASHMITKNSGSSAFYPGSIVTYSYDVKSSFLSVPAEMLWQEGAVSEHVVRMMAENVRRKLNTTYSLAISGIAGPGGGTKDKPVGTVWMAVASKGKTIAKCYQLKGNRIQNIERSSLLGLELLRKLVVGLI